MVERAVDFLWRGLPRGADRISGFLGAALRDGDYLIAWPALALAAPLIAFVVGLSVGAFRPSLEPTYTYSVLWVGSLLALATLGAGIGFWAWAGYVLGNLVLYHHYLLLPDLQSQILLELVPMHVVANLVLFALLVAMPLAVVDLRRRAIGRLREARVRVIVGAVFQVIACAVLVATWVSSIPILIRPVWGWSGASAPVAGIQSLGAGLWVLIVVALVGSAARVLLTAAAGPRGAAGAPPLRRPARPPSALASAVGAVVGAGLVTLGLGGFIESPLDAALLFGALVAAWLIRSLVLPRVPLYAQTVTKVPLVVRIAGLSLVAYAIGRLLLGTPTGYLIEESFRPMLIAVILSVLLGALLIPLDPAATPPEGARA
jgi:hypothetical protein